MHNALSYGSMAVFQCQGAGTGVGGHQFKIWASTLLQGDVESIVSLRNFTSPSSRLRQDRPEWDARSICVTEYLL